MYVVTWGATSRYWRPLESIAPHSGVGGWAPIPRKPMPEVVIMAVPKLNVPITIMGETILMRIWENTMRISPEPMALAASMNSLFLRARVSPRAIRAKLGTV